mgnify:FL=1
MSDGSDIRKAQKGDTESMNRLFDRYYDAVYSYCYRHVKHRETAQDLTQEVFLRVCRTLGDYRHYGKFENFLYVIAGNLCKDHYKKRLTYSLDELEVSETETGFARSEDQIVMEQAITSLPELEREIVYLRFYQDLKIKDIAKILDLGLSTTKYHLKKAQEQLAQELAEGRNTR